VQFASVRGAPEVSLDTTPAFMRSGSGSLQSERCPFESGQAHVEPLALTLKRTPARSLFKKMMGQNNHFLITILVGLDSVEAGQATLSPGFSTAWSPRDMRTSARRSRDFAIKALLAWASDSLNTYRRELTSPPNLYFSDHERRAINAEEGLWLRLECLAQISGAALGAEKDMVELLVVWRNKVVHTKARDSLKGALSQRLTESQSAIEGAYRGLDIQRAIKSAQGGQAPSFKEITALVSAAQTFVERIDDALLTRIDLDSYLRAALTAYVSDDPINRSNNIWGRDPDRRRTSILQVAQNYGMSPGNGTEVISDGFTEELLAWTPRDARRELTSE
jgi:hypothetical protein